MTRPELTGPRRQALLTLICCGGEARYSNETNTDRCTVYWQAADWLVAAGYATREPRPGEVEQPVVLTDEGWIYIIEGESDVAT